MSWTVQTTITANLQYAWSWHGVINSQTFFQG